MTPASARASYRRDLEGHGETVTLRRVNQRPAADTDAPALARVLDQARPRDLVNETSISDRTLLVLAEDLEKAGFPLPVKKGDKIILRAKTLTISAVDDDKRRVGGVLVAYELTAS